VRWRDHQKESPFSSSRNPAPRSRNVGPGRRRGRARAGRLGLGGKSGLQRETSPRFRRSSNRTKGGVGLRAVKKQVEPTSSRTLMGPVFWLAGPLCAADWLLGSDAWRLQVCLPPPSPPRSFTRSSFPHSKRAKKVNLQEILSCSRPLSPPPGGHGAFKKKP